VFCRLFGPSIGRMRGEARIAVGFVATAACAVAAAAVISSRRRRKAAQDPSRLKYTRNAHLEAGYIACVVSENGRYIYTGASDGLIRVWDTPRLACVKKLDGHTAEVCGLLLDGDRLYSCGKDQQLRVWDTKHCTCLRVLDHVGNFTLCLAKHGPRLFCGLSVGSILVVDTDLTGFVDTLEGHEGAVRALEVCCGLIFSASEDKSILCWDACTLQRKHTLANAHASRIISLTSRGTSLFSGSMDRTIIMWQINSAGVAPTFLFEGHAGPVRCLAFFDEFLVSGSWDGSIAFWNVTTRKRVHVVPSCAAMVLALSRTSYGLVASFSDASLKLLSS